MEITLIRRARTAARLLFKGRVKAFSAVRPFVEGKNGLEIGGPSGAFERGVGPLPIYPRVGSLDNCDFSRNTTWKDHDDDYRFSPEKAPGRSIFCDASDLSCIGDDHYDFVLSSHNLEHFANPMKALYEWKRVIRPGGGLIVLLPDYRQTFDHRRLPTPVAHMLQDWHNRTGEDDLSHLPEILEKHDLSRDPQAGSLQQFTARSLDNFNNRCLHHHVFDEKNSRDLLGLGGFEVLAVETVWPCHIFLLASVA